jgi:hypothetical protein
MSCLFHSMSAFLKEDPQVIRNKICDYLQTNPTIMDMSASDIIFFDSGKQLDDYVRNMRLSHVWGGAIEIAACIRIWNRPIRVRVERTGEFIDFTAPNCDGIPMTFRWTGGHYDPI